MLTDASLEPDHLSPRDTRLLPGNGEVSPLTLRDAKSPSTAHLAVTPMGGAPSVPSVLMERKFIPQGTQTPRDSPPTSKAQKSRFDNKFSCQLQYQTSTMTLEENENQLQFEEAMNLAKNNEPDYDGDTNLRRHRESAGVQVSSGLSQYI